MRYGQPKQACVPKTSYYWWREYEGIWKAMDGFPVLTDDFGANWVLKMRRHYAARLHHMYTLRPRNIKVSELREIPKE